MQELRPGLWTWTAPHPDWTPDADGWDRDVRSYAYDSGPCLVLFDPIAPPTLIEGLIESQDVAVLRTVHWHARSAVECVERFGATVYAPKASVAQLEESTALTPKGYAAGDELPGGVFVQVTYYAEEAILWIPAHHAIVAGDVLLGGERGLHVQPDSWLPNGVTREALRDALRPLCDLPLELILLTHGDPVAEDAREVLRAALDA